MKIVKCKYCHYEWETRSQLNAVTCPSCLNKTIIEDYKGNKGENENGTAN